MNEQVFSNFFEQETVAFRRREEERTVIREKLEAIIAAINFAETECKTYSTFGTEERVRLARAKVEVLEGFRSLDSAANTTTERNHRASESVLKRIS